MKAGADRGCCLAIRRDADSVDRNNGYVLLVVRVIRARFVVVSPMALDTDILHCGTNCRMIDWLVDWLICWMSY